MIKHVVIWKFKENEEAAMRKFLDALESLRPIIPEIIEMETGVNFNPENDYDAILISKFESFEALERYKNHPEHIKASALCKEIRIDRKAIDFVC